METNNDTTDLNLSITEAKQSIVDMAQAAVDEGRRRELVAVDEFLRKEISASLLRDDTDQDILELIRDRLVNGKEHRR